MEYSVVRVDVQSVSLKYYVFGRGSPRILITAGIHGGEATGVYAARRLVEYLEKVERVRGSIVVIPVVNVLGFYAKTRWCPLDMVDMNRVFPDGAGSAVTRGIIKTVWEIASSSDYVLDLHCAGLDSYQYILALYKDFPRVKEFVESIAWDTVVESTGLRGQLFVEASHQGIPAAIIETGGGSGYYVEEWGEELFKTLVATLVNLGFVEGEEKVVGKEYFGKLESVSPGVEGFFKPSVKPGRDIAEGDVIGYVDGRPVESSVGGRVISLSSWMYVPASGSVARIAPRSSF